MSSTRPTKGAPSTTVAGELAAIYCRISQAEDDDQTGVDRQERICREIAERRGFVINPAHVFVDNSRSAWSRKRKRPGWDRLLVDARDRSFRHIIAYHPDRLMRQPRDLEELLQVSDDHAITLHGEANRRDLSDPDDRFILRIEVAHACRSSDDTSRRLKSAMQDRAREGKPQGGLPYPAAVDADDVTPLHALWGRRSHAGPFGLDGGRRAGGERPERYRRLAR